MARVYLVCLCFLPPCFVNASMELPTHLVIYGSMQLYVIESFNGGLFCSDNNHRQGWGQLVSHDILPFVLALQVSLSG